MKEAIDREEIKDYLACCKRWSKSKECILTEFDEDCIKAINTEGEVTEEEIDTAIRLYLKRSTRELSRREFVRELTVYRDYFKKHENQFGLDIVNKLINDRKMYDKCLVSVDGSFFNAGIRFGISDPVVQIEGIRAEPSWNTFDSLIERTKWKTIMNWLYEDYEFIPCVWFPFNYLSELETAIKDYKVFGENMKANEELN